MNIDVSKFEKCFFVNEAGEHFDHPDNARDEVLFYHSCFPCRITEEIDEYTYHPKGIDKFLIKLPIIGDRVKKRIGRTFKHIMSSNCALGKYSQKAAVAMVNSGDYALDEALWVLSNACERCTNVLHHKYLGEDKGYAEHSEEWQKCGTVCDFCQEEN